MYRNAPANALFQGDLLVVPSVELRDQDPVVLSRDPPGLLCKRCKKPITVCPDADCGAPLKQKSELRASSLKVRIGKGEVLLPKGSDEMVATLRSVVAMLTSHSCDVDRAGDIGFALVRFEGDGVEPSFLDAVERGDVSHYSWFYLPPVGLMPRAAVDLNATFSLPYWCLGEQVKYTSAKKGGADDALIPFAECIEGRLASLSENGLRKLYAARLLHETHHRLKLPAAINVKPDEDPDRPNTERLPVRGWRLPWPRPLKRADSAS